MPVRCLSCPPRRLCSQYQDDAFHRTYERDHTWEELQEDEHGNLRLVSSGHVTRESFPNLAVA